MDGLSGWQRSLPLGREEEYAWHLGQKHVSYGLWETLASIEHSF